MRRVGKGEYEARRGVTGLGHDEAKSAANLRLLSAGLEQPVTVPDIDPE